MDAEMLRNIVLSIVIPIAVELLRRFVHSEARIKKVAIFAAIADGVVSYVRLQKGISVVTEDFIHEVVNELKIALTQHGADPAKVAGIAQREGCNAILRQMQSLPPQVPPMPV